MTTGSLNRSYQSPRCAAFSHDSIPSLSRYASSTFCPAIASGRLTHVIREPEVIEPAVFVRRIEARQQHDARQQRQSAGPKRQIHDARHEIRPADEAEDAVPFGADGEWMEP